MTEQGRRKRSKAKRWWRGVALSLLVLSGGLATWAFGIEPGLLTVRTVEVVSPLWPGGRPPLRIAVIGDLHSGAPHTGLDKINEVVDRINALKPDLILLLGDYVIHGVVWGRFVSPERTADRLKRLRARHGVFAVLGNHDWWLDGPRVEKALTQAGIPVLENQALPVDLPSGRVWLAGIADDTTRDPQPARTLARLPSGEPVIVFTHDPAIFPDVPARAVLTLASHTHGGQVFLPWVGALISPGRAPLRHAYGLIRELGKTMYVTSGIGTSILPIRFNMPPEIALIRLTSKPETGLGKASRRE